ncbi:MAG: protein kinase [Bradymonadaceae bacterium]|nr:protein kinase [Lujinxingiaceae bacterium]
MTLITIGAFELVSVIGQGGMGEIWRGRHLDQNVEVAVKVMSASMANSTKHEQLFASEVRAVASLHHRGIVRVYDHGKITAAAARVSQGTLAEGSPYLVMELAEGGSLVDRPRPTHWPALMHILLQVLDALAHAHAHELFHRDLKPGNVLITDEAAARPTIKLTDFGLVQLAAAGHFSQTAEHRISGSGTPGFMAPEQILGRWRQIGPWTDLYALGCMVYELATGILPMTRTNAVFMAMAHLTEMPDPFLPTFPVPPELDAWVAKLLAKAPRERFVRAADAAHALWMFGAAWQAPRQTSEQTTAQASPASPSHDATEQLFSGSLTALLTQQTIVDEEMTPILSVEGKPRARAIASDAPPMPMHWGEAASEAITLLSGTGLNMLKMRRVGFVGREEERDHIWQTLALCRSDGKARVIALSGPSGCGKSALAEWIARRADELGAAIVLRTSHSQSDTSEEAGLRRLLTRFFRAEGLSDAELVPFLEECLRTHFVGCEVDLPDSTALGALISATLGQGTEALQRPERARQRQAFVSLLASLARERPVVLCLDNVQWGGDSLELVEVLLERQLVNAPILCLLTVPDEGLAERPAEQRRLLALYERSEVVRRTVRPLNIVEHRRLISQLLPLQDDVVNDLAMRTGGNPLFARELLSDWVERGLLVPYAHGFRTRPGSTTQLPDSVHHVWVERIDRLLARYGEEREDIRVAIELAACAGRVIDKSQWELACAIAGLNVPADLLEVFADAHLIKGDSRQGTFIHEMLRESVERMAGDAGRLASHHRVHLALLDRFYAKGDRSIVERRCRHLIGAGMAEQAIAPLTEAAHTHLRDFENAVALRLATMAERALQQLNTSHDDPRWVPLWTAMALVHMLEDSHAALRFIELIDTHADPTLHAWELGEAALTRANIALNRGENERALIDLERARRFYEGLADKTGMARCIQRLGSVRVNTADYTGALQAYEQALVLHGYPDHRDGRFVPLCLRGLARVRLNLGELDEAQKILEEALHCAQGQGEDTAMAIRHDMAAVARLRGEIALAEEHLRACYEYFRDIGASKQYVVALNLAFTLLGQGRHTDAQNLCLTAVQGMQFVGLNILLGYAYAQLLCCAAMAQDWDAWDDYFSRAIPHLQTVRIADKDIAWAVTHAAELADAAGKAQRAADAFGLAAIQWQPLDPEQAARLTGLANQTQ